MSRTCDAELAGRPNALQTFSKRFNLQGDSNPSAHTARSASDPNRCRKADKKLKVKRLKTRKERSQMTSVRSWTGKQCHQHHSRREGKFSRCCGCSHRHPVHPLSRNTMSLHTSSGLESCIITDSRLIGHRGLFNREVKSIDIERLIVQCKAKPVQMVEGSSNNPVSSSPCLSPVPEPSVCLDCSSPVKQTGGLKQRKAGRKQTNANTQQANACACESGVSTGIVLENATKEGRVAEVSLEKSEDADGPSSSGDSKSQRLITSTRQKETDAKILPTQLFEYEDIQLSTSDGCAITVGNENKLRTHAMELSHCSPQLHAVGKERARCHGTKGKAVITSTVQQVSDIPSPLTQIREPLETGLYLPESNPLPSTFSSESMGERPLSKPEVIAPASLAAVAFRLSQSLETPLFCRRDLLSENRETLLCVLQERHGAQLQENLCGLQQSLCCSVGVKDKTCTAHKTCGENVRVAATSLADTHPESRDIHTISHGCNVPHSEQRWLRSAIPESHVRHRKGRQSHLLTPELPKKQRTESQPHLSIQELQTSRRKEPQSHLSISELRKRQRKQEYSKREMPHIFMKLPQANCNSSPFVTSTEHDPEKLLGAHSPEFVMDYQPTFPSSPKLSVCGMHTGLQLPLDRTSNRRTVRAGDESLWCCPDECFRSQSETRLYETVDKSRITHCPQQSISEWSYLNERHLSPVHHLHPTVQFYSSSLPEISASARRYNRYDIDYYPPSDWLMRGCHSSQIPFSSYPSPDQWVFPRMRLY